MVCEEEKKCEEVEELCEQFGRLTLEEQPPTDQEWDRPGSWCNSVI